ncbi:hypothetical protein [Streptomyces sp. NPDC059649]|uniref:hypothetical protein n=1 Tax=Streptomyces sp. NPDC059649 TaxID=3346895 RepID=UPI00368F37E9
MSVSTSIVGVHGIAQQQLGPHQLKGQWSPALRDGLYFAHGSEVGEPPLDIAFYGDLFLRNMNVEPATKGAAEGAAGLLSDLEDEELADLSAAVADVAGEEEFAAAEAETKAAKGIADGAPSALLTVLRVVDRRFGASAGVLYLGELRQVRRYLRDNALKAETDAKVRAKMTSQCHVLIGHSLGSVVAFEYVRQNPGHPLALLLTLGSPLGLRMVRSQMPDAGYGAADGLPANVAAWTNIRDKRDPVACAGDLRPLWPGVTDRHVDNEDKAHQVVRYLSKREAGKAVLDALPGLAP